MYLRRHCYNKPHNRCPGWAGGGMKFARYDTKPDDWDDHDGEYPFETSNSRRYHWYQQRFRCHDGYISASVHSRDPWRWWRSHRCDTCDLRTIPYVTRFLDPAHIKWEVRHWFRYTFPDPFYMYNKGWVGGTPWYALPLEMWQSWVRRPLIGARWKITRWFKDLHWWYAPKFKAERAADNEERRGYYGDNKNVRYAR